MSVRLGIAVIRHWHFNYSDSSRPNSGLTNFWLTYFLPAQITITDADALSFTPEEHAFQIHGPIVWGERVAKHLRGRGSHEGVMGYEHMESWRFASDRKHVKDEVAGRDIGPGHARQGVASGNHMFHDASMTK